MFNYKPFLLLALIMSEVIFIGEVCAAPTAPVMDLSEVLIFDSDPRSVDSHQKQTSNLTISLSVPNITEDDAEVFLQNLGYNDIEPEGLVVSNRFELSGMLSLWDRIRAYQRANGLKETGDLDDDTKITMGSPHCGTRVGEKRGEIAKWSKSTLTYRIRDRAEGVSESTVSTFMKRAFNEWSKVTQLDFIEKNDPNVDIEINFGDKHHQKRRQRCSFDHSTTLAHAFYPESGDIHFNTKYFFSNGKDMNLFLDTAIHEIGHSLGLEHSDSRASIMYPTTGNLFSEPQPEDVKRIQALYGVRRGRSMTNMAPEFCTLTKYDAALDGDNGEWFLFSGNYYYSGLDKKPIGKLISSKWPGITGSFDAAFRYVDGRTYFFKGNRYWSFKGSWLEPGHPRLISEGFPGLPDNIDAIFVDGKNKLFVLKGSRYWVYTCACNRYVQSFELEIEGLPNNVDAAIDIGSDMVVFKGRNFYRFENGAFKEYTNSWMSC